jgi:hypothetical protein
MSYFTITIALIIALTLLTILNSFKRKANNIKNSIGEVENNWQIPTINDEEPIKDKEIKKKKDLVNEIQNLTKYNYGTFRDKSGKYRSNKELK